MCDNLRNTDTADWRQYHPVLRSGWHDQLTAYNPTSLFKSDESPLYPEATSEVCQPQSLRNLRPVLPHVQRTPSPVQRTPPPVLRIPPPVSK